jgi:hypothetical protein
VYVDECLFSFERGEWLCEEVGDVMVGWDVGKEEIIGLFDMMTEPMVVDVDVLGAMLVDGVLEEGKRPLVVTV